MKLFNIKQKETSFYKPISGYQRGGVEIFIVVIVILIAFLLAGGEFLLGSAFPLPDSLGIGGGKNPVNGGNGGGSLQNGIILEKKRCVGEGANRMAVIDAIVTNQTLGYVSVEISNNAGSFAVIKTLKFTNLPTSNYTLNLPNALGFNTSSWRIRLFEGGTQANGEFSGGTEKFFENGSPTEC